MGLSPFDMRRRNALTLIPSPLSPLAFPGFLGGAKRIFSISRTMVRLVIGKVAGDGRQGVDDVLELQAIIAVQFHLGVGGGAAGAAIEGHKAANLVLQLLQ